mmetsp:Transcript_5823/g.6561  ORF Transcript_5823/g.6561 Transcript_5823/m.6561 type:complete len:109 (-) Transcript_5823:13-339(-)
MQESNMVGGGGGVSSFTGLLDGADVDQMRDPNAIMDKVQNSIGGYKALNAIEGEEAKGGFGDGAVVSSKKSAKSALDLYNTPHSFGMGHKAIGSSSRASKGASSYKYR